MGGDPSLVPVAPAKSIQDGCLQTVAFVKSALEINPKQKILVVWDSVGASLNSAEDEENDDYSRQPGVTAKEVGWAVRRFNQLMEKYRDLESGKYTISVLCVNQVYANIGFGVSGNKQKGGGELEYLSSLILELTKKQTLVKIRNKQKVKYGIQTIAKVKKNHLFGGQDCIAELDLIVNAAGVYISDDVEEEDIETEEG
jgi:RecA/RadA recombinase